MTVPITSDSQLNWPTVEGRSSFHDVTLLTTPLLSEAEKSSAEQRDAGGNGSAASTSTTIRILRFGFGRATDIVSPWRWDPFEECRGKSAHHVQWSILTGIFPCLDWMTSYKWSYLKGDFLAGLSVGFMLIPQGMAYARVAGLQPVYGLYTGFAPSVIYAIFGSSRQMALGPTSLVSLLVGEAVRKMVDSESTNVEDIKRYLALTLLLAFMVGVVQVLGGVIRLGWTVRFLSHAVVSGFSSGAALIIGLTQMRYFLGYRYPRSDKMHIMVRDIIVNYKYIDYPSLIMGSLALVFLLVMKHYGKTCKKLRVLRTLGPILAVTFGILFIYFSGNPWGIRVTGSVPTGPPEIFVDFPWKEWESLLLPALVIGAAAYLESVGMAKALAAKNGYAIDANQELVGLGMANVVGSLFSAYPTGGSFSRSIVNNECGAKTGLAGIAAAMLILFALLCFTPLFEFLPLPVLAAIVLSSVVGLVDHEEAMFLLRVDEKDFIVWLLAFGGTLFFGIQMGVLVAVFISLGFVIEESANPQCEVLGRLPGTTVYRTVEQYPDAKTTPGIIALRFHSPLYFANVSNVREALRKYENLSNRFSHLDVKEAQPVRYVIVDMTSVSSVDSAACQAVLDIYHEYQARGIRLAFTNPNKAVMRTLERANIPEMIGRGWFFVRVYDAVRLCKADMARTTGAQPSHLPDGTPSSALHKPMPNQSAAILPLQPPQNTTAPPSVSVSMQGSYSHLPTLEQLTAGRAGASNLAAKRNVKSLPMHITGGLSGGVMSARGSEVVVDLKPQSAPELLRSHYVLLDELDLELFTDSPAVDICPVCKGVRSLRDDFAARSRSHHVLLSDCTCS